MTEHATARHAARSGSATHDPDGYSNAPAEPFWLPGRRNATPMRRVGYNRRQFTDGSSITPLRSFCWMIFFSDSGRRKNSAGSSI